jgi:hypothetical protein
MKLILIAESHCPSMKYRVHLGNGGLMKRGGKSSVKKGKAPMDSFHSASAKMNLENMFIYWRAPRPAYPSCPNPGDER